jgi:hypothetical protein
LHRTRLFTQGATVIAIISTLLPLLSSAVLDVPPGVNPAPAMARARDGDVVRLAAGSHAGALGRVRARIRVEGAGAELTEVVAPEGEDGLVVDGGEVELAGLALRAGPACSALKVLGGAVRVDDVLLHGGAAGAFVDGGRLHGREVDLAGEYGLLARGGAVVIEGGRARGQAAGVALLSGSLALTRFAVTGPSREAGITVTAGEARLHAVTVRSPGPTGIAVTGTGRVVATALDVAGAREVDGMLGACLQLRRGALAVGEGSAWQCGGAVAEVSAGELDVRGMDATAGEAGAFVLVDGARAELVGNRCGGHAPGVVATSGATARIRMNRWRTDPVLWVDCGSGARVSVGRGEGVAEPCRGKP